MKAKLLTLILVLFFLASTASAKITGWGLGNDTALGGRVGWMEDPNAGGPEVGAEIMWYDAYDPATWSAYAARAYGLWHSPVPLKIPLGAWLPGDWAFPETVDLDPYFGGRVGPEFENHDVTMAALLGFLVHSEGRTKVGVEFSYEFDQNTWHELPPGIEGMTIWLVIRHVFGG